MTINFYEFQVEHCQRYCQRHSLVMHLHQLYLHQHIPIGYHQPTLNCQQNKTMTVKVHTIVQRLHVHIDRLRQQTIVPMSHRPICLTLRPLQMNRPTQISTPTNYIHRRCSLRRLSIMAKRSRAIIPIPIHHNIQVKTQIIIRTFTPCTASPCCMGMHSIPDQTPFRMHPMCRPLARPNQQSLIMVIR